MHNKSDVKNKIKNYCSEIRTTFNENIIGLCTNGDKEYVDKDVKDFFEKLGTKHIVTVSYTPEQNGTTERENRTIIEAARSILYSKPHLPMFLWAEAMKCAVYILNRTGITKVEDKMLYELWFNKKASFDHFKVVGTECFIHIPKEKNLIKRHVRNIL